MIQSSIIVSSLLLNPLSDLPLILSNMEQKTSFLFIPLLLLLLLLLLLVFAASSDALPASRSLRIFNDEEVEPFHDSLTQDMKVDIGGDSQRSKIEELLERRIDIETRDYPGTGANNHHDPRSPGLV